MNGPTRWRDDDSAPAEVRDLLRGARGAARSRPLPAASRARSVARLDRMLALPVAAGLILWLKGVAIAAGIGVLGVVAVKELPRLVTPGDEETTVNDVATATGTAAPKVPATVKAAAVPSATPVPAATATVPAIPATTTPAPTAAATMIPSFSPVSSPPPESAPSAQPDSLAREAAMLDRARALLGDNPAGALAALDAHAAAFPAGHMSLEREVLAVEALRRLHRFSEARARGESLLRRDPGSIYADRVRAILATLLLHDDPRAVDSSKGRGGWRHSSERDANASLNNRDLIRVTHMKSFNLVLLLCTAGLSIAGCSGKVDIAREATGDSGPQEAGSSSGGPREAGPGEAGPNEGGPAQGDDGGAWDGWSAGFASSASGPRPACASAALACGAAFPGETAFASSQDAANALVGQWSFCGQNDASFYPANQLGEEYAADGTYYELIMGSSGQLVRNMDPQAIGTWQVDLTPNNGLEVHTLGGGVQRSGGLSACPPSLVTLGVEARLD